MLRAVELEQRLTRRVAWRVVWKDSQQLKRGGQPTTAAFSRAGPKHSPQPVVPSSQMISTMQPARVSARLKDHEKGVSIFARR